MLRVWSCQAKDKVLQSLNDALRKLKVDEDAEERLHKMVVDGRDRLGRLHQQLGECMRVARSGGEGVGCMPEDIMKAWRHWHSSAVEWAEVACCGASRQGLHAVMRVTDMLRLVHMDSTSSNGAAISGGEAQQGLPHERAQPRPRRCFRRILRDTPVQCRRPCSGA